MFEFLVKSASRRRMLAVLWEEQAQGSASELARLARVSFATAYRELRAMTRHGLASERFEDGVAVFAANEAHPLAVELRRLVSWRPVVTSEATDDALRRQLAEHGAPVHATALASSAPLELEDLVTRGVALARRDPATAR